MSTPAENLPVAHHRRSALAALAGRMGVEADALFLSSLRSVAFKSPNASNEQLLALCVVANQYGLNPFTKELYAFPDKGGGVVPIVSVDGWSRIMNEQASFDGMEFVEADDASWVECIIYRKDRQHPLKAREWLAECKRNTDPWKSHPRRMLRHKAMIQAARMAFGFAGIYDPDEGERIVADQSGPVSVPTVGTATERLKTMLIPPAVADAISEQQRGWKPPEAETAEDVHADQVEGVADWLKDNAEPEAAADPGKPGRGRKA